MKLIWSKQQNDIYDWVRSPSGSRIVIAVAGSGKTTTIVECAEIIPPSSQSTFVAFNKHIADTLKLKLPDTVRAMTLNALGNRAWTKFCQDVRPALDPKKTWALLDNNYSRDDVRLYGAYVNKLVGLAKTVGMVPFSAGDVPVYLEECSDESLSALEDRFDVQSEAWHRPEKAYDMVRKILAESIKCGREIIDFNDQLYLPVIFDVDFLRNDWLFVDEAQDVNALQLIMLQKSIKEGGHLLAVGDPKQSIYAFRGASHTAIEELKSAFGAEEMPLTVSYRCPKLVVAAARAVFPFAKNLIEHAEGAIDGYVGELDSWSADDVDLPKTIVLCRNNAPLAEVLFKLKTAGVNACLKGKDSLSGVIALVKKLKPLNVENLGDKLTEHFEKESEKLTRTKQLTKLADLSDRVATLRIFIDNSDTLLELGESLNTAAKDSTAGFVTLSTVHKAKGLEFDNVFILDPWLIPSKWAVTDEAKIQENNLLYVAITRAKQQLLYINTENFT
jgi:DNA helicase-2/ATP-dependent DNA helicase PcrA